MSPDWYVRTLSMVSAVLNLLMVIQDLKGKVLHLSRCLFDGVPLTFPFRF